MPEQDHSEKKRRALFDLLRQQKQQQPETPERSYFDPPEPDREKERQQVDRQKAKLQATLPHVAPIKPAKPASTDRHDPRNTFNRRSEVEKSRQDSILARYKTERQKASALAHLEDATALRKDAQERFEAAMAPIKARWDRIDLSKPVPGEMVLDLKERENRASETHRKDLAEIETDLDMALKAAHSVDMKVTLQTAFLALGYTPDASEHFAPAAQNWPQRFSRAVDPEQDEARQALRARAVTTPENEEISQSPEIEEVASLNPDEADHSPEPDETALHEQYELEWLSVFSEIETNDPAPTRPEMPPEVSRPKPF